MTKTFHKPVERVQVVVFKNFTSAYLHLIIQMQKFQRAYWLRTRELIPNSAES